MCTASFVTRDNRYGIEGFGGVEGGEPLVEPTDTTGFCQVQVHAIVDNVARDEQAHVGDMQHRRRVGVGVTDLDRNERDAVELEIRSVDDGHVHIAGGQLSGEHPIPEIGTKLWMVLRRHQFRRCLPSLARSRRGTSPARGSRRTSGPRGRG